MKLTQAEREPLTGTPVNAALEAGSFLPKRLLQIYPALPARIMRPAKTARGRGRLGTPRDRALLMASHQWILAHQGSPSQTDPT
jgi:hypothetical protein